MADSSATETAINVSLGSNQERLTPEIRSPRSPRPFNVSSIMAEDLGIRSRTSSAASAAFLNATNNNNNYTDTITSNRSRHLSFTRLAYNLSAFNREFDKIPKEKTNPFLRIVDPRCPARSPSIHSLNRGSSRIAAGDSSNDGDNDDQVRQEDMSPNETWTPPGGKDARTSWSECCSRQRLLLILTSIFPILKWSSEYSVRENFIPDLIAGLTIIVFHVPQSMGYSLIAHVSPVYGLYTAFFPALIYSLMGTSKHCAIGMFAVISLMTGTLILEAKEELALTKSMTGPLSSTSAPSLTSFTTISSLPADGDVGEDDASVNIRIAVAVSFLIGFYQLLFGIMQMGFISVYLSEQLVSGFTTAASLYVFTSQLPFLFGVHLPHRSGPLALLYAYSDLFAHLDEASLLTISISVTCCIILLIFKTYVNHKIKDRFNIDIPFPIELILVIIGTTASYFLSLETKHVAIVGTIPSGLPAPDLPDWSLMLMLAKKSIPLAIVGYTLTISVGKIFASRHHYEIDPNQEMIALGSLNLVSCFFFCLPSAASLSRSAVQESAGGRTQLVSIINCIGILFVLYFAGGLLEKLPICILASIIAVALKSLFFQIIDFIRYWRVSKLDASIWLITFVAVVLLDVDLGLYVGLGYSLLTLIYKSQRPKTYLLGSVGASDVYVPERKYASAVRIPAILIYQFCGPLHFANTEFFQKDLILKTGVSVPEILKQKDRAKKQHQRKMKMLQNGKTTPRVLAESGFRTENELQDAARRSNLVVGVDPTLNSKLKYSEHGKRKATSPISSEREEGCFRISNEDQDDGEDWEETTDLKTKTGDPLPSHIIIDCSMFSYIDTAGISQLKSTVQDYESVGIKTFLAGVATHVDHMLELDGFYRAVLPHHVYITIHDAVHHAQQEQMGVSLREDDDGDDDVDEHGVGEEASCLNCSTNSSSTEEVNLEKGCRDAGAVPPAADHLRHYRDRLNNRNSSSSLPIGSLFEPRRSIVGFFEKRTSPTKEQKITQSSITSAAACHPEGVASVQFTGPAVEKL